MSDSLSEAEYGLAILDGLADRWAEEIGLTAMIRDATSPARIDPRAPADIRAALIRRMEQQVDAIARQAFCEGAFTALRRQCDGRTLFDRLSDAGTPTPREEGA